MGRKLTIVINHLQVLGWSPPKWWWPLLTLERFQVEVRFYCFWQHLMKDFALLLMEEILHHLWCMNPINNGLFIISTGAGFLPSRVLNSLVSLVQCWYLYSCVKCHHVTGHGPFCFWLRGATPNIMMNERCFLHSRHHIRLCFNFMGVPKQTCHY